jgi:hypothetical protein
MIWFIRTGFGKGANSEVMRERLPFHFYDETPEDNPLPTWPRWLCWLLTRHRMHLHWADYTINDCHGTRCFCGKREEVKPYA